MTQFIKTNVNVYQTITEKGETREYMTKEPGYLYKQTLNIRKQDTYRWTLSHQISGLSVMDFNSLNRAKKATPLIHSLIDWTETNTEKINEDMKEHSDVFSQISYADENELEVIKLKLLENTIDPESIIELMMA